MKNGIFMIDPKTLAARFPGDFTFGVATAAFQIEGASKADGR
jgi:beta-glucosidase